MRKGLSLSYIYDYIFISIFYNMSKHNLCYESNLCVKL